VLSPYSTPSALWWRSAIRPCSTLPHGPWGGRHEDDVLGLVALLAAYAGPQMHGLLEETHRPCPAKAYRRPFHPARTVFGREEFLREPSAGSQQSHNRRSGSAPQREGLSLSLSAP